MTNKENLYQLLNVKADATTEEIKASFRRLALRHHPDKNNNSDESKVIFQILSNAYNTLISPAKRREYDNYLKTSSALKSRFPEQAQSGKFSLGNLCEQLNFILWEIEDILKLTQKQGNNNIYSGYTIHKWVLKILIFIDKWVLEPGGFGDYFYEARGLAGRNPAQFFKEGFNSQTHQPYYNIRDYFYAIRKRTDKFTKNINIEKALKPIEGNPIQLIDAILEAQMLSYHYLGALHSLLNHESATVSPFVHTNPCFETDGKALLDFKD